MLSSLIRFSIQQSGLVILLSVLLVIVAAVQIDDIPVEVFPELNAPTVVILTESGGLAADEVEQYVTFPIESAVNGLPGVRRVRSSSAMSLSIVWVEFDWGDDIYRARQLVSERLSIVEERLPEDVHMEMAPVSSIAGEIMLISLSRTSMQVSDLELRAFGEFDLRNQLLAVPGVSQVVTIGGELPEYQVHVEQDRLRLYGLSLEDVARAAGKAHSTVSAGYLTHVRGKEIPLRQDAKVQSVDDIRNTVLTYTDSGAPITIGNVAQVNQGGAIKRGTATDSGQSSVVLSIQKAPGVNALNLTAAIDNALDELEPMLPEGMTINRHGFRQSDFIERAITNVMHVIRDAAVIVSVILILFLMNVRTTVITLTALPMSLALTLLVLAGWGSTINVMTLGGIAVAIGALVDDAIIDVENVFRRLQQNYRLPEPQQQPHAEVVLNASNEIRSSIVFATVMIVMVFIPLLFLEGLEGRFFTPLGIAYIVSILASLLVAMTLTPALCAWLLKPTRSWREHDSWLLVTLKALYAPLLKRSIRHRILTLSSALAGTVLSLMVAGTYGSSFLPEFNEGTFTVFLMAPPGTSLEESDRLARGIDARLAAVEGVRGVIRRTGRAESDEHAEPVSNSEIDITIQPGYEKEEIRRKIDEILTGIPGITTMVGQPIQHRLSHILSGTPASIAINVFGDSLERLRLLAKEIEQAIKAIPGTRDVAANREVMIESLPIHYRLNDLSRYGLTPSDAAEQVQTGFYGETVSQVNQGIRRYDIVVRLSPDERQSIDDVRNFILRSPSGALVRLADVADIGPEMTSNLIMRENTRRKAIVSCNVAEGYNLGDLVEEVQAAVDPIVEKEGYTVAYGGQFEAQQSASKAIYGLGSLVVIAMFIMLVMVLGSVRSAGLVMINLPLALIGGIVAIFIMESHSPLGNLMALVGLGSWTYEAPVVSIASLVGFVTLFGIAVRNGILLINHYRRLLDEGLPLEEAVMQGSLERLSPILMTALTAILGLLPLVYSAGEPGSELLAPLAVVVLGGLVTSTLLNLLVIPAGYALVHHETFNSLKTKGRKK